MTKTHGFRNYSTWYTKAQLENVRRDYEAINALVSENKDISAFADAIEDYVLQNRFRLQFPPANSGYDFKTIDWVEIAETWVGDMD